MILKKRFWGAFLCLELADGKKTHGRLLCEGQGWVLLANRNGKTLYRLRDLKACRVEAEAARDKLPGQYRQQANDLAALWKAQNPDLAYNTGRMSAEEYKAITGKYPKGYTAPRSGAAVRDPYGMGSLSDAQRSTQIRGLLESLNKGDASARAKALNYISANEANFTDNELNNFTSALEKGMRHAGYNL